MTTNPGKLLLVWANVIEGIIPFISLHLDMEFVFLLYIKVILFYIVLFNSASLGYLAYVGIILGQRYYGCWICLQFIVRLTKYCYPFTPNIALLFPIEIEVINFNCSVHTFKYLFSKTSFLSSSPQNSTLEKYCPSQEYKEERCKEAKRKKI